MPEAYIGLGANLGDCAKTLGQAVTRLRQVPGMTVGRVSSLYRTSPVGLTDQPDFFNLVVGLETGLSAEAVLRECLAIEQSLGRERAIRWGPRVIDLDVLWHSLGPVSRPGLDVPHPRMTERAFVMIPLAEIAPDLSIAGQAASAWARLLGHDGVARVGELPEVAVG